MVACGGAGNVVQVSGTAVWQVRNSSIQVRQGDEFSLTCVVTSLTPIDVIRIVLERRAHNQASATPSSQDLSPNMVRRQLSVDSERLRWTVADNYDVKQPFSSLPRYRLYYSYNDGIATSTLTYRGGVYV